MIQPPQNFKILEGESIADGCGLLALSRPPPSGFLTKPFPGYPRAGTPVPVDQRAAEVELGDA